MMRRVDRGGDDDDDEEDDGDDDDDVVQTLNICALGRREGEGLHAYKTNLYHHPFPLSHLHRFGQDDVNISEQFKVKLNSLKLKSTAYLYTKTINSNMKYFEIGMK